MKNLSCEEKKLIHTFLKVPLPEYVREYSDEKFDLMDCYEIGFVFAHDLLRNQKIDPLVSPWGDGKSVIFDPDYSKLLTDIVNKNQDESVGNYCRIYLNLLKVFKNHLI